jgi:hypothetical protein
VVDASVSVGRSIWNSSRSGARKSRLLAMIKSTSSG